MENKLPQEGLIATLPSTAPEKEMGIFERMSPIPSDEYLSNCLANGHSVDLLAVILAKCPEVAFATIECGRW